jgi:homoserine/homoserine lactone efflux protein
MNGRLWLAFTIVETALCLIPGQAVLFIISSALRRGVPHALAGAVGVCAGNTLYFVLSALGIVALLEKSYTTFITVTYCGAAYLAFLGLRSLFAPAHAIAAQPGSRAGGFVAGFVTQVSNPKALVFFVALLPQFIDPHAALWSQVAILALTSVVIEFATLGGYAYAIGAASRTIRSDRLSAIVSRAGGVILIGIALKVAVDHIR